MILIKHIITKVCEQEEVIIST